MALRYLDSLRHDAEQQEQGRGQTPGGESASSKRSDLITTPGHSGVLRPEFLIFRNVCSAVLAQVGEA